MSHPVRPSIGASGTTWAYISLDYATYAVALEQDVVIDAAPIASWMVGKSWIGHCLPWLRAKGALVERLQA